MLCQGSAVGYSPSDKMGGEAGKEERWLERWEAKRPRLMKNRSRVRRLLVKVLWAGLLWMGRGCRKSRLGWES